MCTINNYQAVNQSFVEQVISNPAAVVAFLAMIANIVVSIVNLSVSSRNRKNESLLNTEIAFYKMTVLKSLEHLFGYIAEVKKEYTNLVGKYQKLQSTDNFVLLTQDSLKRLDALNEEIEASVFPYYDGFSSDCAKKIREIFEKYYDSVTLIYSSYSNPSLGPTAVFSTTNRFSQCTGAVIQSMYVESKLCCPAPK